MDLLKTGVVFSLVLVVAVPAFAGCMTGRPTTSRVADTVSSFDVTDNRSGAGWFQLAVRIDGEVSPSDLEARVTIHWGDGWRDSDAQPWLCGFWGPRPDPGGGAVTCRHTVPDGRLQYEARVQDNGARLETIHPACCRNHPRSDTFRLSSFLDEDDPFGYPFQNASVAYFIVYGGGAVESMSYNVTVASDVEADWAVGPAGGPFTYHRRDFASTAWARAETVYFGEYYAQEDGLLRVDPRSPQSELLMYVAYHPPDHGTDEYDAWLRPPGGDRISRSLWVGASHEPGRWEFGIPRSVDDRADSPVVMGTSLTWLQP